MRYNIKENGQVVNTIIADEEFMQANYNDYEAIAPVQKKITSFTKLEFLELLTDTELEDFLDIEALPAPAQRPIRAAIKKFEAAAIIDVSDERTIKLINGLVALNILTQARADIILQGV